MAFEHRVTVRFYEIDRAGIAFFGRFYEYCHAAFEEMQAAAFGSMEERLAASPWLMPVVHSEADFVAPVRLGDRLVVALTVERVGGRSLTFAYDVRGEDGSGRAKVKLVHATIDRQTFEPVAVPRELLDGLRRLGLVG